MKPFASGMSHPKSNSFFRKVSRTSLSIAAKASQTRGVSRPMPTTPFMRPSTSKAQKSFTRLV